MSHRLPAPATRERIAEAVAEGMPATIAELSRLVRIPSVSWDGFDQAHVAASAEAVAELLRGLDFFDEVRVATASNPDGTPGRPAVLATRPAREGKPTVLLYAHHDVQPPGEDRDWDSPPFEPVLRPTADGDRLYGRGAADDKAGVMAHIAAIRALVAAGGGEPGIGVAVFIEGEEEYGSQSFRDFIVRHRADLAADAIIVADSDNWDHATPAITATLRGNATFVLGVRTLAHASHSGMFGGAAPDATLAAIRLLSTLWDEDGAVTVAGLHRHEAATPDYDEGQLRAEAALLDGVRPIGRGAILDRIWNQPSITVTGMDLPSVQHASNTLAPAIRAKISVRIAPGQTAAEAYAAVEAHLRAHAPHGAVLEFEDVVLGEPFQVDTAAEHVELAKAAMAAAWGRDPVEIGIGGSIPFIATLVDVFPDAQILVTGIEDPDTRAHSPNESLHLGVLRRAVLAEALFLAALDGRE